MHPSHLGKRICICVVQDIELKTLTSPNLDLDCIQSFCLKPIKVKGSIPTNDSLKDSGPSSVPQSSANPSRSSTQDPSSALGKKPHTVTTDTLLSTGEQDTKATMFDGRVSVRAHADACAKTHTPTHILLPKWHGRTWRGLWLLLQEWL